MKLQISKGLKIQTGGLALFAFEGCITVNFIMKRLYPVAQLTEIWR